MTEFRYYILDGGELMRPYCEVIIQQLRKDGCHVVYYDTDLPTLMQLEEVDEDTFLGHCKSYLKSKSNEND